MRTETGCAKLCLTDWKIQATLPVSLRYATGYFMISHGLLWLTLQTLTAGEGVQSSANVTLTNRVRRNIQTSITHTSLTLSTKEFKPQLHCLHLEVTRSNLASLRRHCLDSQQQVALLAWVVFSYLFMSFNGVFSVSCASVCALYELVWNFTIAYIKCSFAKHYF